MTLTVPARLLDPRRALRRLGSPVEPPAPDESVVARVGWSFASLLVVLWGIRLWLESTSVVWASSASLLFVLAGLGLGVWVFASARSPGRPTQAVIMLLLAASVCSWGYLQVLHSPAYGTDAAAFDQYAAELTRHGANPYTHSLLPSLQQFQVPPIFRTFLLDGHEVGSLSYPALAFLPYLPALWLGLHAQAAIFTDLAVWAATLLLLWRLLPARVGWAAALLLGEMTYAQYAVGGVTDMLFLPFLLLALWRWDRYGDASERGPARWLSPIALGLALAVKQMPWFLLPFLLIGLAQEGRRRGDRAWHAIPIRYLAVALAVFTCVNLPFLVADPVAWLRGVTLPLRSPTVPGGQGVVNLALFQRIGGNLDDYKLVGGLALVTALTALALYYRTLKRAWVPLVAFVFFWPTRSLASYLVDLAPVALVAAATASAATPSTWPFRTQARRLRRTLLALPAAAFLVTLVLAITSTQPLQLEIVGLHSTGQLRTVDRIELKVHNRSSRSLEPHFTVVNGAYFTTFWYTISRSGGTGSPVIPAHATRRLLLRAPNSQSMPSIDGGFVVFAFTARPATVSTSAAVPPTQYGLALTPEAVNRPVPAGTPLTLTVQLIDRLGNPVRRAGARIVLGQVVYGQDALIPAEASINGRAEGQSPVTRRTNQLGQARFVVRGVQPQAEPVFFQGWIAPPNRPPSGFSNQLAVQFTAPPRAAHASG